MFRNSVSELVVAVGLMCWVVLEIVGHRRTQAAWLHASLAERLTIEATAGSVVPSLIGFGDGGRLEEWDASDAITIVLVYSETCPICATNWPMWDSLRDSMVSGTQVVAVSLGDAEDSSYALAHRLARVVYHPDATSILAYRLMHTPQTILLGRGRVVSGVWTGALTEAQLKDILGRLESLSRK